MPRNINAYFPALTGVRAVAAYMVFIHHFNFFATGIVGNSVHNFFAEMHVGVTLFFVLSGLLLTLRYADRPFTNKNEFYNYMVNRFAKIYPVYFIIISLNFLYYNNIHYFDTTPVKNGWLYYLGSVTFLRGFFADFFSAFVSQSWSLTVEECFYLLCPLFLLAYRRSNKSVYWLPAVIILSGCLLVQVFKGNGLLGFMKDFRFMFNFTFFGRCIEFFTGMVLGILYLNKKRFHFRYPIFTYGGLSIIIFWIFLLSLLHTEDHYGDYFPAGILINNFLLPVTGIAVFYWGLLTEISLIRWVLQSRLFSLLGKSSYCFYLLHLFMFVDIFRLYASSNPILIFLFILVLSIGFYKYIEHPLNVVLKRRLRKEVTASTGTNIQPADQRALR